MTTGLLLTSFAFGLRHGFDWDHIAAIADLNSASTDRRRGALLSLYYALGHAAVVLVLGGILIFAGAAIPESLDDWMGRVVGATLIGLGMSVLFDIARNGGAVRLRSRWMLVLDGTFAGLHRVRKYRGRRQISIEHDHGHEHDGQLEVGTDHEVAADHDHAHDDERRRRPQRLLAAVHRPGADRIGRRHQHRHLHRMDVDEDSTSGPGRGVAVGVGILHGVGIESPTQIAIFVASTSVVGTGGGFMLLFAWVVGLILANAALVVVAASGLLRPGAHPRFALAVAIVVAGASLAIGARYLFA